MLKKFENFVNELYTNPFNPDEIWEIDDVIIDDIDDHEERYKILDYLIGKEIEFFTYHKDNPIRMVLYDYKIDMPYDGDYEGYFFMKNDKGYSGKDGEDYFSLREDKPIKVIK